MIHHPPHIYLDDTWYFVTPSALNRLHFLRDERVKLWVTEKTAELADTYGINTRAWVVLDNHYHLLLRSRSGQDLGRFFGQLHGSSSRQINLWNETIGRQVWHNYWDTCIRSEGDFWVRFNYIHHNPVKHGYVRWMSQWRFSSYHHWLSTKGQEWLDDVWPRYPVIDFLHGDDFDYSG